MLWRSKKPRGWLTPNSGPQLRIAREGAALENETPESFPAPLPLAKLWQYLLLVEVEELSLVRAYLLDVDLVVAGVYVLPDHLPVWLGVRPQGMASATISSVTS